MTCHLWIPRPIWVHLRDQLAELEEMRRAGYAEGYTDGTLRHSAGGRTEFPDISPKTTHAPSLEGA